MTCGECEDRRHPKFAPERCPECNWTNVNLMNYGEPNKPRWMCHGCAARALADRARMQKVVDAAKELHRAYGGKLLKPPGDWACKECKPKSDWPTINNGWRCPVHALIAAIDSLTQTDRSE